MYKIAQIDAQKCSESKCHLCSLYCPEPNTIIFDSKRNVSFVAVDRCKGCGLCVRVCTDIAKRNCIKMIPILEICNGYEMSLHGFPEFA